MHFNRFNYKLNRHQGPGKRLLFLLFSFILLQSQGINSLFSMEILEKKEDFPSTSEVHGGAQQNLDFFIQNALEFNHQLKASKSASIKMKKIQESQTMVPEDPMFSAGIVNSPLGKFPAMNRDPMSGFSFMLSQKIALPGETKSRKQMAMSDFFIKSEDSRDMELKIAYQVRLAYYELNFLYNKEALLKENRDSFHSIISVARAMVSANKMNSAQLLKLEASLSELESEIQLTSAMILKKEFEMEELTLLKPPYHLGEKTDAGNLPSKRFAAQMDPFEIRLPHDFDVTNHPRYRKAKAMIEKSSARKKSERSKNFPSLTISAEYMVRSPVAGQNANMSGEDMVSLRISAPFPLYFPIKQNKKTQAAENGIEEAKESLEQTALVLNSKWMGEKEIAEKLLEVYSRYHNDTLPRYFASYKAMLGSLSSSTVTLLDVLDSYRAYLDASIKETESYRDLQKTIAMLQYLEAKDFKQNEIIKETNQTNETNETNQTNETNETEKTMEKQK